MKKKVNKEFVVTYYGVEIFFEGLNEASKILGIKKAEITACIHQHKQHETGYGFRFKKRIA